MYTQSITRAHRTAFLFAIDCSGSMAEEVLFSGRLVSKAEAVAEVTNRLLFELVERARRSDGIRDYYDVAVLGYSGEAVVSLLPAEQELVPVTALSAMAAPVRKRQAVMVLPDGSETLREIVRPEWVTPRAGGQTPLYEALLHVRDLAAAWCRRPEHAASFPPVIFNITDGEASDCDEEELRGICDEIRSLGTTDGHLFLINIHIAGSDTARSIIFPSEDEIDYANRYARLLFECSSEMPAVMHDAIRAVKGPLAMPPFRGMSYNASIAELISILNIGSISVNIQ